MEKIHPQEIPDYFQSDTVCIKITGVPQDISSKLSPMSGPSEGKDALIPHYEEVLEWFSYTDFGYLAEDILTKKSDIYLQFRNLYISSESAGKFDHKQLLRYHSDWEKLFVQKETFLPPIPEAYIAQIYFCAAREDTSLRVPLDDYLYVFHGYGSEYLGHITFSALDLAWSQPKAENIGSKSSQKPLFSFLNDCMSSKSTAPEGPTADATPGKESPFNHSCQNLIIAYVHLIWSIEERFKFHRFIEDPINASIIEQWLVKDTGKEEERKEKGNKKGEQDAKPLTFPVGYPNDISRDTMESFVGYISTEKFDLNIRILALFHMAISVDEDVRQFVAGMMSGMTESQLEALWKAKGI
ncbi:hypothetical protein JCM33374_g4335 [Metschnikowia sp. JCM 33374]|nr:hypothetical protein JCM33374_g4335 [Metschnikowia sp. JCM 33374]